MGGLTAAALLSKAGLKVCVLEMASRPGGYLSGFNRSGFHFETAIHWLNQCGPTGFVRRVFDLIAQGAPATASHSRIRRFKTDTIDYLLTNKPDALRDSIITGFGADFNPVTKFFRASKVAASAFSKVTSVCRSPETMSLAEKCKLFLSANTAALPLIGYSLFSAQRGLTTLFNSAAMRELFSTEDQLLSCLLPVGWAYENDYQLPPIGGSQAFPIWMCGILAKRHATVAYNTRVTAVNVVNGQATGVTCVHNGTNHDLRASYVIAACDVESLLTKMLPKGTVKNSVLAKHRNAEVFNSCTTLSIGLDCSPERLGLNEELVLLRRNDIARKEHGCGSPDKTELSIIAASFRDPTLAPKGKGTLTIYAPCTIDFGNYWATDRDASGSMVRGKAYKDFKQAYADILLNRIENKLLPGLRSHIEFLDIATPLTYQRYTGNRDGAIMGFRPSFRNIRNRIAHYSTPVKNLYVGGQWAELGGGLPVAVRAGMNSAFLILKQEAPATFRSMCEVVDNRGVDRG